MLVHQNNVTIYQNLNLRINILARDDERESLLLYDDDDDVWMIISLSSFFKKLDYYREIAHDIVDTDKLYECFIDLYDNFLFSKLSQEFQLSTLSFLKNHLEPVKNYFLCSNVLFHLFSCPRSNYAVNPCALCSRLYIDPLIDCVDLHNTDLRYKLIKSSIFAYDVKQLFKNNFITQFKLNICYKSLEQYTVLNSDQKRCLQLSVFQNECDIIIKYCEVLIRIFLNFFYSVSESFAGFEKPGKLTKYFECCLRFIERFFERMAKLLYADKFKEIFLHYEPESDYDLSYIRIINKKYSKYCIKKFENAD